MTYLYMNRLGMWMRQTGELHERQVYSAQIIIEIGPSNGLMRCLKNVHGSVGEVKSSAPTD